MAHKPAAILLTEYERLAALERMNVLDTLPEQAYDDIVMLATQICGVPIALVSLIDQDRQWFKACIGLDVTETHRDMAFCAHAILVPTEVMVVEDTTRDERFSLNPLVVGKPHIRFYAGAPIVTDEGQALGTVCLIDTKPRSLSSQERKSLQALARQTATLLQLRNQNIDGAEQTDGLRKKIIAALADSGVEHAAFRQQQRVASIGQLTSGVAHDFNNLLQSVSISLQLIERKAEDSIAVRRMVKGGLKSVERGARLISQLLAFSRDEAPTLHTVLVADRIGQMKELISRVLSRDVRLHFEFSANDIRVSCDPTQLEAAILNIVINARDAMNNRGELRFSTQLRDLNGEAGLADGQYLEVRVSDTGPGMPYSIARRAFDPFFSTKGDKGTGLGLSQVYGFSLKSGGIAQVESRIGEGTDIIMLLKPTSADICLDFDAASALQAPQAGKASILLVDEDTEFLSRLMELLTEVGYTVQPAQTGSAALYAIEQNSPDVVVADFSMRGLSGPLLINVMKEAGVNFPIIFMTGRSDMAEVRAKLPLGTPILQKPFQLETLMNIIEAQPLTVRR